MPRNTLSMPSESPHPRPSPLLLIDVDGVLSLWGFGPEGRPGGQFVNVDGIVHFISEIAVASLRELAPTFELVWCSGWEEKANEHLLPLLQLPGPFPVIPFDRRTASAGGHWKLPAIESHVGPTDPLAWIDDTHDEGCATWADARQAPTLLITTQPPTGLTKAHAQTLTAWASTLTDPAAAA